FLKEQLTKELSPLMGKVQLLENYGLNGSILLDSNEIEKRKSLDEKEVDELTNLPDNPKETQPREEDETNNINKANLFDILTLYGRTIRNSEDISITNKKEHLRYCFLGYIVLLAIFKEALEDATKEIELNEK